MLLKGEYELSSLGINVDEASQFISVITRIELLSKQNMKPEEEAVILKFLTDVVILPLDESIERKTIEIRRARKLKLPDSIIAATAIVSDAILITNDQHLSQLALPHYKVKSISQPVTGKAAFL